MRPSSSCNSDALLRKSSEKIHLHCRFSISVKYTEVQKRFHIKEHGDTQARKARSCFDNIICVEISSSHFLRHAMRELIGDGISILHGMKITASSRFWAEQNTLFPLTPGFLRAEPYVMGPSQQKIPRRENCVHTRGKLVRRRLMLKIGN